MNNLLVNHWQNRHAVKRVHNFFPTHRPAARLTDGVENVGHQVSLFEHLLRIRISKTDQRQKYQHCPQYLHCHACEHTAQEDPQMASDMTRIQKQGGKEWKGILAENGEDAWVDSDMWVSQWVSELGRFTVCVTLLACVHSITQYKSFCLERRAWCYLKVGASVFSLCSPISEQGLGVIFMKVWVNWKNPADFTLILWGSSSWSRILNTDPSHQTDIIRKVMAVQSENKCSDFA